MSIDTSEGEYEKPVWLNRERKRGILTEDDRSFLAEGPIDEEGEKLDKQTIRDKRYRIRERLKNALLDFNYLSNLDNEDRKNVFEYLIDEGGPTLQSVFETLYLGVTELGGDTDEELDLGAFVNVLERAIIEAERRDRNYVARVSIDIEIERTRPDPDSLLDKMLEGRGTLEEFLYYVQNEEDKAALFNSVVDQEDPLVVTTTTDDAKLEVLDVETAEELLDRETEILNEGTDEEG